MRAILCAVLLFVVACTPDTQTTTTTNPCQAVTLAIGLSAEELADAYPWLDPAVAEALGSGKVEEEPIEVFRRVEKMAILAEQHPECFSVEERLEIESSYRQWLRWRESQ